LGKLQDDYVALFFF